MGWHMYCVTLRLFGDNALWNANTLTRFDTLIVTLRYSSRGNPRSTCWEEPRSGSSAAEWVRATGRPPLWRLTARRGLLGGERGRGSTAALHRRQQAIRLLQSVSVANPLSLSASLAILPRRCALTYLD